MKVATLFTPTKIVSGLGLDVTFLPDVDTDTDMGEAGIESPHITTSLPKSLFASNSFERLIAYMEEAYDDFKDIPSLQLLVRMHVGLGYYDATTLDQLDALVSPVGDALNIKEVYKGKLSSLWPYFMLNEKNKLICIPKDMGDNKLLVHLQNIDDKTVVSLSSETTCLNLEECPELSNSLLFVLEEGDTFCIGDEKVFDKYQYTLQDGVLRLMCDGKPALDLDTGPSSVELDHRSQRDPEILQIYVGVLEELVSSVFTRIYDACDGFLESNREKAERLTRQYFIENPLYNPDDSELSYKPSDSELI